jgi:hypothetical protein
LSTIENNATITKELHFPIFSSIVLPPKMFPPSPNLWDFKLWSNCKSHHCRHEWLRWGLISVRDLNQMWLMSRRTNCDAESESREECHVILLTLNYYLNKTKDWGRRPGAGKLREEFSLQFSKGTWLCQYCDFILLASIIVKKYCFHIL